jgi:hypothetical protein
MNRKLYLFLIALIGVFYCPLGAMAQVPQAQMPQTETQTQYLSGHGKDDAVPWDFYCTAGRNSGKWTKINVPSNWELQGFGRFTYQTGPPAGEAEVQGRYKRTFQVPAAWANRRLFIVFEGVMTDTQVSVNGQSAGPMHQGGYYQFRYDITNLVKVGQENLLEVTVDEESANASINRAERRGDYWNYAGIFRPVILESVPNEFIERTAINAKADGSIGIDVFPNGTGSADSVQAQVLDLAGHAVGAAFSQPLSAADQSVHLQGQITSPRLWTAETPNLYQVDVRLKQGAATLHSIRQRFGFRTIELRPGDGLYVNGNRVILKGCDRHSFWPDSGRTTSEKISRLDIGLMKDMNMNAVRMSHYPPDQHFLDDCDEMGLYVLDELGGWQHAYDTPTGHRLVREMVTRDVNHPSILIWDNGNEGGWNPALDDDFALWDPQGRHVQLPGGNLFRGVNDPHYPDYARTQRLAAGPDVYITTEFLHANYDGGAGAGLADYWDVMYPSKTLGGAFIWAFLDEDVKRVDLNGQLDGNGNKAPDGIVGPYREKEASYFTIKEVWSPIVISQGRLATLPPDFNGTLTVQNRYDFLNAKQCHFTWQLRRFQRPGAAGPADTVLSQGPGTLASPIAPHGTGTLKLGLPSAWQQADALAVRVDDPTGHELWTWVWPLSHAAEFRARVNTPGGAPATATETADGIQVRSGALTAVFSKLTGQLMSVRRGAELFGLSNGPRLVTGDAALTSIEHHADGKDMVISAAYSGDMKTVRWRIHSNGWIQMSYEYALEGPHDFFGVGFDCPETSVKAMTWLGQGPYRVWKNRQEGTTLGVWSNTYNDTITGDSLWKYPEFKGYYGGVRWIQLQTTSGPITAILGQDDLFVQVLTPKFSPDESHNITPAFPTADLSFLNAIPPIGSKFSGADRSGPQGQLAVAQGSYHGTVSFYFGSLPPVPAAAKR